MSSEETLAKREQIDVDYRVVVAYTVPIEVTVDVTDGTVDCAVAIHEGISFNEEDGVCQEATRHPIPSPVAKQATEIAEAGNWPAWEHRY